MEDIIRVIRILEYTGPRSWVEKTIAGNIIKGSQKFGGDKIIREAILGDFPEIVEVAGEMDEQHEK